MENDGLKFPNKTYLWTQVFMDELYRAGVTTVVIAPGSRSTPLAIAFARHPGYKVYSHLDERSAAYLGLGIGLKTGKPCAIVCTSGTAAANFFPAVVEASKAHVPLLLLTADRPQEARESGANQTIDQVHLYGRYVRWFVEAPLPEPDPAPVVVRSLRTLADRAVNKAMSGHPGPVHINFPFRKPLEPEMIPGEIPPAYQEAHNLEGAGRELGVPFTRIEQGRLLLNPEQVGFLAKSLAEKESGIIICGPRCPGGGFGRALSRLAEVLGWPVLADPLSGLRFNPEFRIVSKSNRYETYFSKSIKANLPDPDCILQFGEAPTSKSLLDRLESWVSVERISIHALGEWVDETHSLATLVAADPEDTCNRLADYLAHNELHGKLDPVGAGREFSEHLALLDRLAGEAINEIRSERWWEGLVLAEVVETLPEGANLVVSNSLPVRHLDQFAFADHKEIHVYGNRGASGIDGTISTACGIALASDQPTVLVIGDLSFYHDMNGLLAIQRHHVPLLIVLINNDGGGIFERLPVANYDPPFQELFRTPHGLNFSPTSEIYKIPFKQVSPDTLKGEIEKALASHVAQVIEIRTDAKQNEETRKMLLQRLQEKIDQCEILSTVKHLPSEGK